MATPARIRLLDADPDLFRHLSDEERGAARALGVPVVELPTGPLDLARELSGPDVFGAIVLEGMVLRHIRVGEPVSLRLLGPGDMLACSDAPVSPLIADSGYSIAAPTRLALVGGEVMVAARRWSRLVAGLHERAAAQSERASVLLAICKLPRVEDRILALMWLLAESWGRVTRHGTVLPISLTHEAIGGLIGARRPTVTLALGELAQRGALERRDGAWILSEKPPAPTTVAPPIQLPAITAESTTPWVGAPDDAELEALREGTMLELHDTVARLSSAHAQAVVQLRLDLDRMASARASSRALRDQVRGDRELRRRGPVPAARDRTDPPGCCAVPLEPLDRQPDVEPPGGAGRRPAPR